MAITRDDVARRCNVSSATVSKVINNDLSVGRESRERILCAIKEINYIPDENARKLSLQKQKNKSGIIKTNNLGCIVGSDYMFSDHFFSKILEGAGTEAIKKGYYLSFVHTLKQINENNLLFTKLINRQNIDGVILINVPDVQNILGRVLERVRNAVMANIGCYENIDNVSPDFFMGGYTAVKHLVAMGHKRIAFTGYHAGPEIGRFQGYLSALNQFGLEYDESIIEGNGFYVEDGYRDMSAILERSGNNMPTAVFAVSDREAIGVIKAVKERGLRVPEDISVIGFDNIMESEHTDPPLTTINVNKEELGRIAVQRLQERILNQEMKPVKIICPVNLIERKSVRKSS